MSKSKVKLAFIENDAKRRAVYNKQKKGLLNKVSELTTLCGINDCSIVYSKFDFEPNVWPSTLAAQQVISQFRHMRERIMKLKERLNRPLLENCEKDPVELMFKYLLTDKRELDKLSPTDLDDPEKKIEKKMMGINSRVNGDAKKEVILDGDEAQSNPTRP
ncbi:hypothetical protein M9H77_28165 [Catharanthus roseus]|uniref:Uncharacterized protein n=1 Tax=Catharanthus roseus TaxID=4058 RepID=A0ACC0AH85_CATRO|nr:hypothetical protein M9H77_28165 [Catharanthus roseus]